MPSDEVRRDGRVGSGRRLDLDASGEQLKQGDRMFEAKEHDGR